MWSINGEKISTVFEQNDASGDFNIEVNLNNLGLPNGNYIYQFEAVNNKGVFRLPKFDDCSEIKREYGTQSSRGSPPAAKRTGSAAHTTLGQREARFNDV